MLSNAAELIAKSGTHSFRRHPLASTKAMTIEMEYDSDAKAFVTYVKELDRMSSFGESEESALDSTAEMIRGYIRSMETQHKRIPLAAAKLAELKQLLKIH